MSLDAGFYALGQFRVWAEGLGTWGQEVSPCSFWASGFRDLDCRLYASGS